MVSVGLLMAFSVYPITNYLTSLRTLNLVRADYGSILFIVLPSGLFFLVLFAPALLLVKACWLIGIRRQLDNGLKGALFFSTILLLGMLMKSWLDYNGFDNLVNQIVIFIGVVAIVNLVVYIKVVKKRE